MVTARARLSAMDGLKAAANPLGARKSVYVIDDSADVRKSLHFALESSGYSVWPFGNPRDFLEEVSNLPAAPILLDLRMPDIDGLQLLHLVRDQSIEWPVILMTAHGDVSVAVAAMKLGALDFLEKPFSIERLEELLEVALGQLSDIVEGSRKRDGARQKLASLTPREHQVALMLGEGKTTRMIAEELGLSARTVEVYRAAILSKFEVSNTSGAVRVLVEAGSA